MYSLRLLIPLVLSAALAIALVAVRVLYTGNSAYLQMVWNLFLAWIPLACALLLHELTPTRRREWGAAIGLGFLWLIFLPNAPYLMTDLIHLSEQHPFRQRMIPRLASISPAGQAPVWYDAMLLFAFAWNGMLVAIVSLRLVHTSIARAAGTMWGWIAALMALLLCAYGVSLGRFQRFNSWDLFTEPFNVLAHLTGPLHSPMQYARTIVASGVLGTFLVLAYACIVGMGRATAVFEENAKTRRGEEAQRRRGE